MRVQEVLNNLGSFLLRNFVDLLKEDDQAVEVKKLKHAFRVLVDALDEHLVHLCVALGEVDGQFIGALVHCLDDRVQVLLGF